jgi:hypothetical protein
MAPRRSDAFESQLAGGSEHFVAVGQHVLAVEDRALQLGFVEQHFEDALALDLRRFPQVEAFQEQQVEGVEHHPALLVARKIGLEFGEICPPFVDDNDLSIEDRPLDRDIECIGDDRKERLVQS